MVRCIATGKIAIPEGLQTNADCVLALEGKPLR